MSRPTGLNLPTDDQLRVIAQREALKFHVREPMANASYRVGLSQGVAETLFHDLKIDRDSYRLLTEARSFVRADGMNDRGLSHRIDAHLTTLRTRLGITEQETLSTS